MIVTLPFSYIFFFNRFYLAKTLALALSLSFDFSFFGVVCVYLFIYLFIYFTSLICFLWHCRYLLRGFFRVLSCSFSYLFLCLVGLVYHCYHLVEEYWADCFAFVGLRLGLFALPIGVVGRLCSVIMALPFLLFLRSVAMFERYYSKRFKHCYPL